MYCIFRDQKYIHVNKNCKTITAIHTILGSVGKIANGKKSV